MLWVILPPVAFFGFMFYSIMTSRKDPSSGFNFNWAMLPMWIILPAIFALFGLIIALEIGDRLPTRYSNPAALELTSIRIYDCATGTFRVGNGEIGAGTCIQYQWHQGQQIKVDQMELSDQVEIDEANQKTTTMTYQIKHFKHRWYNVFALESGELTTPTNYTFLVPPHALDDGQYTAGT